jgi:hypothetical protein
LPGFFQGISIVQTIHPHPMRDCSGPGAEIASHFLSG